MNRNLSLDEMKSQLQIDWNFKDKDEMIDKSILSNQDIPNNAKVGIIITRLAQIYEEIQEKILEKYDLTGPQMNVLKMLFFSKTNGITQDKISQMIFTSKANVSTLLSRMQDKELIERIENPNNKREKLVKITNKGKDKIKQIHKAESHRQNINLLSNKDNEQLINLLNKLRSKIKELGNE